MTLRIVTMLWVGHDFTDMSFSRRCVYSFVLMLRVMRHDHLRLQGFLIGNTIEILVDKLTRSVEDPPSLFDSNH